MPKVLGVSGSVWLSCRLVAKDVRTSVCGREESRMQIIKHAEPQKVSRKASSKGPWSIYWHHIFNIYMSELRLVPLPPTGQWWPAPHFWRTTPFENFGRKINDVLTARFVMYAKIDAAAHLKIEPKFSFACHHWPWGRGFLTRFSTGHELFRSMARMRRIPFIYPAVDCITRIYAVFEQNIM